MTTTFKTLEEGFEDLSIVFEEMNKTWHAIGETSSILEELNRKIPLIKEKKIIGLIGYLENSPQCIAIIEFSNKKYGTLMLYSITESIRRALVEALCQEDYLNGSCLELFQIENTFDYRDAFIAAGFFEKERQRMIHDFKVPYPAPENRSNAQFEDLSLDHIKTIGEISHAAHQTRQNIEGYYDFSQADLRANMARKMRDGYFGKTADGLCLLMSYKEEPAGVCDVVDITMWHYPKIAWIMDITVHPEFQGIGLGEYLLETVMHRASENGFPAIGLAVTLSNINAVKLYEKKNFQQREFFVEIISPNWSNPNLPKSHL